MSQPLRQPHDPAMTAGASWPAWYRAWRTGQADRFDRWGLPTKRQENWKYTPLASLAGALAAAPAQAPVEPEDLAAVDLPGDAPRVTFVDGRYRPELSTVQAVAAPRLLRLGDADERALAPFRAVLKGAFAGRDETTAALAAGRAADGLLVEVPAGAAVGTLELLHLWVEAEGPACANLHHLIHLGVGAELDVRELHVDLGRARVLANVVTTVVLDGRATCRFHRVQARAPEGALISRTDVHQAEGARFEHAGVDLGGHLVRHDLNCRLAAQGASASLVGVYVLRGEQHVDNHTRIDHLASDTRSEEHYKGVLDGSARGVFNGKVVVHEGTAGIKASQVNRNLLLSRMAEIDSKPELEIYSEDVQCSHGATVGQLDEDQLFYLQSRGLPHDEARALLLDAFCGEIVRRIPDRSLAAWVDGRLARSLPADALGAAAADGQGAHAGDDRKDEAS